MIKFFISIYVYFRPFIKKLNGDNVFAIAGQSAFFIILSAVPLAMFAISIFQNLHIPEESLKQVFGMVFNEQATKEFSTYLSNMYKDATGISVITLIGTLWSAAKGVHCITNGLNRVYNTYENRKWLFLRLRAMLYTVLVFLIVFVSMLVVMLSSVVNDWIKESGTNLPAVVSLLFHLRYVIIFFYIVFMFALMYRNFPNLTKETRREYSFVCQLPGALFTAVSWFLLTIGISIYVTDFHGFSLYGGLLRLTVIMVWLYLCMGCFMIGAEINYYYHSSIKAFYRILSGRRHAKKRKK